MHRTLRHPSSLLVAGSLVLLFPAISSAQVEQEPNNTPAQANVLDIGSTITGTSCDDPDYFRTVTDADGTLTSLLQVTNQEAVALNISVLVFNTDGVTQIGNASLVLPAGATQTLPTTTFCNSAGEYFFRVNASGGCASYSFTPGLIAVPEPNEVEPNDVFPEATFIAEQDTARGAIRYQNTALDVYDWWRASLPTQGTVEVFFEVVNTNNGPTSYGFVNFQNDGTTQGSGYNSLVIPAGDTLSQTFTFHCIAPGNYYFRVEGGNCGHYKLSYRLLDTFTANEQEPNDVFAQATPLAQGDTARGHIRHQNITTDFYDWWRADLPEHGSVEVYFEATNTSGGTATYYFVTFQNDGVTPGSGFNSLSGLAVGATASGTYTFHCLSPGSYYFRVEANTCGNYRMSYRLVDVTPNEEQEPNDSFVQAQPLAVGDTIQGHIWHSNATPVDPLDFYLVQVPDSVRITVHYLVTAKSLTPSTVQVTGLRPDQSVAGNRNTSTAYLTEVRDSMVVDCFDFEAMRVRIGGNSCHSYKLWVTYRSRVPTASFTRTRSGNTISFTPDLQNVNTLQWQYGDGGTSTAQFPIHTYAFGNYTSQLTVSNTVCDYTRTTQQYFELSGVQDHTPKRAGPGHVQMQLFGGSMTTATNVQLVGPGGTFTAYQKYATLANSVLTALFDLSASPGGVYDLLVDIPGFGQVTIPNGFTVEALQYPTCNSEVVGPDRFLISNPTQYRLVVSNPGNVTADGVLVSLAWPASFVVSFPQDAFRPPMTGNTQVTVSGTTYILPNENLASIHDLSPVSPITTINGQPYSGFYTTMMIPHIMPGGTVEIPFTVVSSTHGLLRMYTGVAPTNMYHQGNINPHWVSVIETLVYHHITTLDLQDQVIDYPPGEVLHGTAIGRERMEDVGTAYDDDFYETQNGGTTGGGTGGPKNNVNWANEAEAAAAMADAFAGPTSAAQSGALTQAQRDALAKEAIDGLHKIRAERDDLNQQHVHPAPFFGDESVGQDMLERLNRLFGPEQDLATQAQLEQKLEQEAQDQQVVPRDTGGPIWRIVREILRRITPVQTANSFDPNAIYGPMGVAEERYLSRHQVQNFMVTCENVDSATASAQRVWVYDTLDVSAFDLSTFSFGNITIGNHQITVPQGSREFVVNKQLDPSDTYRVRINGRLDDDGVITWEFITLDLATNNLPVFDGFLPPNVNAPEGEASMLYSVRPYATLPSATLISSRATIIFDNNEAIVTEPWTNITDDQAPVSFMTASLADPTTVQFTFNGSDDASGIGFYTIYVSRNGGDFLPLAGSTQATGTVIGTIGDTYAFYCEATDRVGNREIKEPLAEATVTITGIAEHASEALFFTVYPNPSEGPVFLRTELPMRNAELLVYDAAGRMVRRFLLNAEAGNTVPLDLEVLGAGNYTVSVRSASGAFGAKRVVVVR